LNDLGQEIAVDLKGVKIQRLREEVQPMLEDNSAAFA
jgi:hypothetical protein